MGWAMFSGAFLLSFVLGGAGLPLAVPPLPEDPVAANIAPQECLFYAASAGMALADAKSVNQTEQLTAETEVREMAAGIRRAITAGLQNAMKKQGTPEAISAQQVVDLAMIPLTKPAVLYVSALDIKRDGPTIRGGVMVNLGEQAAKTEAAFGQLLGQVLPMPTTTVEIAGRKWQRLEPRPGMPIIWGFKDSRLWIGVGQGELEAMLKRAQGEPPAWLTKLRKELPVERLSTMSYVDLKAIIPLADPQIAQRLKALGLGNVTTIRTVTGLEQGGLVNKTLLGIDGRPEGLLRLAGAKPLTAADLGVMPSDATVALAFKLDPETAWKVVEEVAGKIHPEASSSLAAAVGQMEAATGLKLREQLLAPLGDTWRVFDSPSEGGALSGLTAVVSLKDPKLAAATHAKFLALLQKKVAERETQVRELLEQDPRGLNRFFYSVPKLHDLEFAGQHIYVFEERGPGSPPFCPSWCLTDKELIVAIYPQAIKGYLTRGEGFQSLADLPVVAKAMTGESGPLKLAYLNVPRMFDVFYPMTPIWSKCAAWMLDRSGVELDPALLPSARAIRPHLRPSVLSVRRTPAGIEVIERGTLPTVGAMSAAPMASVALLLPARSAARAAAKQMQSTNQMKQISLAIHNYAQANRTMPPAYTVDKAGKPLLSWRVLILPYLEDGDLHREFHLDEPWDSPNNKKLLSRMPSVYRAPASSVAESGKTNYLAVRGPRTILANEKPVSFAQIRDGLSNTIMTVEVADDRAVPWTKPDDFEYDDKDPLKGLVGLRPDGFIAGLADGSVQIIRRSIDPTALRAMFTRDGGEPVGRETVDE
ncbi:MAG: DUF1559 domain-containing protein [Planctomycetaceae bacterium]|nr:DUF1559 domain-containing protein [Planctomycetaceae bacterium]